MPFLTSILNLRRLVIPYNQKQFLGESASTGIAMGLSSAFMPILALRWGASPNELALLGAMPYVIYTIFSIPAGRIFERSAHPRTSLAIGQLFWRASYLLIAALPWISPSLRIPAMILISGLAIFPAALYNVAIIAVIGDLELRQRHSWIIGIRRSFSSLSAASSTLLAGWLLTILPFPGNYQTILLIAFSAGVVAVAFIQRLDYSARPAHLAPAGERGGAPSGAGVFRPRQLLSQHRPFFLFCLGACLFNAGYYMTIPLFPLYQVKVLGANEAWIGLLATIQQAVMVAAVLLWAKLTQRWGVNVIFGGTTAGWSLVPLAMAFTSALPQLIPIAAWHGLFWSGWALATYVGMLETAPASRRASFTGFYTSVSSMLGFVGPLVGVQLQQHFGFQVALGSISLMSITGAIVLLVSFPIRKV
ncbi:MAG: MFS transporter [Chloroflexi bacterium]|nr:MFS transporter [Chloroflexota bacterium]